MRGQVVARPGSRGFTLFELVIVMVIVGALAALVAPRLTKLPRAASPDVVAFLESERTKSVETGTTTEIRLDGRTLTSSTTGAKLVLDEGASIHLIHPAANDYMPGVTLTRFYADGTMRATSLRVTSATSAYTVDLSPFAHRIRHARAE